MIPALRGSAVAHPDEQFQQVSAYIRDRDINNGYRRHLIGGGNDTLIQDEAPDETLIYGKTSSYRGFVPIST